LLSEEINRCNIWVEQARAGSQESLDRLIEVLSEHLWREVSARRSRRGMGPSNGLSDLVQDTLVRVREKFSQFEHGSFLEFKQWARAILFRRWQELARNHQARTNEEQRLRIWMALVARGIVPRGDEPDTIELLEDQEKAFRLLESLRPHEKNIIQLRLMHGLKFREIAAAAACTEDAARMAYARAIDRLKGLFESDGT